MLMIYKGGLETYFHGCILDAFSFRYEQWTWQLKLGWERFTYWSICGSSCLQTAMTLSKNGATIAHVVCRAGLISDFFSACQKAYLNKNSLGDCDCVQHKFHDIPGVTYAVIAWVSQMLGHQGRSTASTVQCQSGPKWLPLKEPLAGCWFQSDFEVMVATRAWPHAQSATSRCVGWISVSLCHVMITQKSDSIVDCAGLTLQLCEINSWK